MLTSTLTLDDASGDDTVYVLISQDVNGSTRRDQATSNAEPSVLRIQHTKSGSGTNTIDRHLVQFSKTELDVNGVPRNAVVNLTMAVPQAAVITNQDVIDLVSNLIDFISDGGFSASGIAGTTVLTQLLRGES